LNPFRVHKGPPLFLFIKFDTFRVFKANIVLRFTFIIHGISMFNTLKFILIKLLIISNLLAFSQTLPGDSLRKFLLSEGGKYFQPVGEMSFSISSYDLFKQKPVITPSLPSTMERVRSLKKKLNKTWEDAAVWNEIGQIYKNLGKAAEADSSFERAMFMLEPRMLQFPRDESLHTIAGMIWMNKEDMTKAIASFKKVLDLDPRDTVANMVIPMLYMKKGELDETIKWCIEQTYKNPELPYGYMFHFMAKAFETIGKQGPWSDANEAYYGPKTPEEIFDFSIASRLKWKEEGFGEQKVLYYGLKIIAFVYKGFLLTKPGEKVMKITENDRAELKVIEEFLLSLEKDKSYTNHYALNKMLGMVYVVTNRYKESANCFEKALDHFPVRTANFLYNPAETYGNLFNLTLLSGDTARAEKSIRRKIKDQPAIDPVALDRSWLARMLFWKKDMDGSLQECLESLKIDQKNADAHLGLAVIYLMKGEYSKVQLELDLAYKYDDGGGSSVYALAGIQALLEGKKDMAKELFKMATKLNPNDDFPIFALKQYF